MGANGLHDLAGGDVGDAHRAVGPSTHNVHGVELVMADQMGAGVHREVC